MKITRIEAIPVHIPLKTDRLAVTAHGRHIVSEYVIVRLHTDESVVGLGEATVQTLWSGESARTAVSLLQNEFSALLVGQHPFAHQTIMQRLDHTVKANPFTKAAIDMALWDIRGKVLGQNRGVFEATETSE